MLVRGSDRNGAYLRGNRFRAVNASGGGFVPNVRGDPNMSAVQGFLVSRGGAGPLGDIARQVGKTVASRITGKTNPDARPGFAGERHIPLPTNFGLTKANFAGPGTQIAQRIKRGDVGVDGPRGIDQIAKQHDLDYVRATKESDIRKADNDMINRVKKSSAGKLTKKIVIAGLKAKKLGEDLKVTDVNTFTESVPPEGIGKGPSHPAHRLLKMATQRQNRVNAMKHMLRRPRPNDYRGGSIIPKSKGSCHLVRFRDGSYRPASMKMGPRGGKRRRVRRRGRKRKRR